MKSLTSRVSAVIIVAATTAAACASSSGGAPRASSASTSPPSDKVATTEASPSRPAAPLPTTLLPGVGMSTSKASGDPDEQDEISGPPPACTKDEDCWSKTCCPAHAPEDCVHASRARKCAIVDITCKPSPMHFTCVCDTGSCKGRLAPP